METTPSLPAWIETVTRLRSAPEWQVEDSAPVEMKQTHISVVLLGKDRVLKLKKPVDFGFLDYTTLEKRRLACEAEVRLNRRLCDHIYLGVQPISMVGGIPRLSDCGPIIDYGVLMQRLPADRMLDEMVRRDTVSEAIIDRVATRLSEFHRAVPSGPCGEWERIKQNWEENFSQTMSFVGRTISAPAYQFLHEWVAGQLERDRSIFQSRVHSGKIVDGHGDVRCESVCVVNGICLFDCIEFNDRFRCGDVASEAAFLAMDLDSLGRPDLGYYFTERYEVRSPDSGFFRLMPFYRCYRAYVRGKVLSFRLDEAEFSSEEKRQAAERAAAYFDLAHRYASRLSYPAVIIVSGLSGTGKTSLARAIAGELGLRVVSTDEVRQDLFGAARGPTGFGEGAYRPEANRQTYQVLFDRAAILLDSNRGVVLDGTFLRPEDRAQAATIAETAGAQLREIECQLEPALVQQRLDQRQQRGDGLSDATWEIYLRQRAFPGRPTTASNRRLLLDTRLNRVQSARTATDWLRAATGSTRRRPT